MWTGASKDYSDYILNIIKKREKYHKKREGNENFEFDSVLAHNDLIKGKKTEKNK